MEPLDLPMPWPGEDTRTHVSHIHGVYVEDVKLKSELDEAHAAEHQWAFGSRLIEHVHTQSRNPYVNGNAVRWWRPDEEG